ncbi:MAG: peptide transporter [Bacteroidetes bacterium HGW-Bacteroidetes-17]|jgi:peptide/nickel transport system permease protein|nr:MAG: peptide transporter [Bacteroidetes bacterium HGW-Bacteroidetes-17]
MLFRKREYISGTSLSKLAWKKLLQNKIGIGSMIFILLIVFISILGYLITPDPTPLANAQALELAALKPGTDVNILQLAQNKTYKRKNFINRMLFGQLRNYDALSYSNYRFEADQIITDEYTQDSIGDLQKHSYLLANVYDAILPDSYSYNESKQTVSYLTVDSVLKNRTIAELQNLIINEKLKRKIFILGSDRYGRDYLSRLMIGARVSLSVGFISVSIALIIGILLGSLAGFFRSWVDHLIVWLINVVWSIPTLLLVIAITFALGRGFWQVFIAVGLTMWVEVARIVRGQILTIREKEFVEAGRALGFTNFRIIFNHILPNIMSPIIVISAANFASAILIEAGLSFLGIGVQPPMPSWGTMIKENYAYIILDSAYLAILPGIAIMLMVLAFMLLGNSLREALDVRIKSKNE